MNAQRGVASIRWWMATVAIAFLLVGLMPNMQAQRDPAAISREPRETWGVTPASTSLGLQETSAVTLASTSLERRGTAAGKRSMVAGVPSAISNIEIGFRRLKGMVNFLAR